MLSPSSARCYIDRFKTSLATQSTYHKDPGMFTHPMQCWSSLCCTLTKRSAFTLTGKAADDSTDPFHMALDSDQCMVPVASDSPALALAQRPRLQLSHGMPHDSATSLLRLDMHLLLSPLSKGVSFAALGNLDDPHASPDPRGSLGACMRPSRPADEQETCMKKGPPPQLGFGTHAVPMIISPDDHHVMQCQVCMRVSEPVCHLSSALCHG